MYRILVVVFDDETKASEGEKALLQLDHEGSIDVCCHAILVKQADDTVKLAQKRDFGPLDCLLSTPVASLIALLGGPEALAMSAATGFTSGKMADADNARLGNDFVDDVRKALRAGKVAVIAEITENWTAPVDARMEQIGGIVFRRALSNVRRTKDEDDLAAMQADLDQLKEEQSFSESNRKVELQEKINELSSKMNAQLQKAEGRRAAASKAVSEGLNAGIGVTRDTSERVTLADPAGASIHD